MTNADTIEKGENRAESELRKNIDAYEKMEAELEKNTSAKSP